MAIGIDKYGHAVLLAKLETLIDKDGNPQEWRRRKQKLAAAYQRIGELIEQVEESALDYKKLNAEIRSDVSEGLRKLKKSEK